MRRWIRRMGLWLWLARASGRRAAREVERGSQSLEWVGLGMVVFAIMSAAYAAASGGGLGASVAGALGAFIRGHIPQ